MLYLVTYDLVQPGQNYTILWAALEQLKAKRALLSTWLLKSNNTAVQIRDYLWQYMDANDRLLVTEMDDWAAMRPMVDINKI